MADIGAGFIRVPKRVQSLGEFGPGSLNTVPTTVSWLTANRAVATPFFLPVPVFITALGVYNGATVSGNLDLGIYSAGGARLISTGSVAQAGANLLQAITVADTMLGPGEFWFAVALDNTTGTVFHINPSASYLIEYFGASQMASSFPLPTTWTPDGTLAQTRAPLWFFDCKRAV